MADWKDRTEQTTGVPHKNKTGFRWSGWRRENNRNLCQGVLVHHNCAVVTPNMFNMGL
ncbi:hypothetical protein M758_3G268700 [Ceratodon purpureus]|nr:hypothetical protein M758_3G268700 [Ceratodon purpureus]